MTLPILPKELSSDEVKLITQREVIKEHNRDVLFGQIGVIVVAH